MKEKCLDHLTTLLGLDEKTIEEDFKAVDTDEDGKVSLEEGMKVYEYYREMPSGDWSFGLCVYDCCSQAGQCYELKKGPEDLDGVCEAKIERFGDNCNMVCTLKATTICSGYPECETDPYSGEDDIGFIENDFVQGFMTSLQ